MNLADQATQYRLAHGSFVSIRYRYLYFETPKVACTKTKSILWELEGLERREPWPAAVHKRQQYDGRISLADCGPETVRHILSSPDWFKFCFVRNPYSRLLSGYQSKVVSNDKNFEGLRKRLADRLGLSSVEPRDIPFEVFVRHVCEQDDDKRDEHWRTQTRLLFFDQIDYNFVGRLENYAAGMAYVLGRLSAPRHLIADLHEKVNSTGGRRRLEPFDKDLAAMVHREYGADFENFGYDPESYLTE